MSKEKPILVRIDGDLIDLNLYENKGELVYPGEEGSLEVLRHSASHLLAQAVIELFPNAKYGVGPAIENGFYYDFLVENPFTPEDLNKISKKMKQIVKKNLKIERIEWNKRDAINYFKEKGQDLKVELIEEKVEGDTVSLYKQGDFIDLCRGPHLPSTGFIKNFKLLTVAAAYWKGDEKSHSMQRIYGTAFWTREELDDYLNFLKEAELRDHRRLGKELDLFSIQNEIGPGIILWHPKGSIIRYEIEKYWLEEHLKNDYELLNTPHIAKIDLWKTSGHLDFYHENMFPTIDFDNSSYQLKPMNCPFHISIFKSRNRSYKDLPLRWAELGTVYRYERSGVLHGLMRVRGFTQDDAHIFCTPEQLEGEVEKLLDFTLNMLSTFGFKDVNIYLSTRPDKYVGELENWELATSSLENALKKSGLDYEIDPGEGVFYGPKIDIKIKDVLGRLWQCSTIQIDFNLPERFKIKYIDKDGQIKQPIMIHRALLGSLERFFGVLIENYGGFFPLWLAPVQAIVLTITDKNMPYGEEIFKQMKSKGIRVEIDRRSVGVGKKIRDAEVRKIPYIIIVGDNEEKEKNITYRIHKMGDRGSVDLDKLIVSIKKLIEEKSFNYEI